jgi:8-oxo-dGTP diphosphatase
MNKRNYLGVGTGVIIRKHDQLLLLRRKNVHGAGSWSTPGGHLEFGETPEDCAIREVKEETGLDISNPSFIGITNDVFVEDGKHYITIWLTAVYQGGEALLGAPHESDAIAWFKWEKLPEPLFLPFQHLIEGNCYPTQKLNSIFGSSSPFNNQES